MCPFVPYQLPMAIMLRGAIVNTTVWLKLDAKIIKFV